jgi:hypothetical protein
MASRIAEPTAAERDRRAIRWLIVKVAVFLLVPVIAAVVAVTFTLR